MPSLVELNGPIANMLSTRWGFGPSRTLMDVMMRGWNPRTGIFCHPWCSVPVCACVCMCWEGRYGNGETAWPSMDRCEDGRISHERRQGRDRRNSVPYLSHRSYKSITLAIVYLTAAMYYTSLSSNSRVSHRETWHMKTTKNFVWSFPNLYLSSFGDPVVWEVEPAVLNKVKFICIAF